jgi:O-acetylhomoserine sulfhydrolase (EC 2.5.1.49)
VRLFCFCIDLSCHRDRCSFFFAKASANACCYIDNIITIEGRTDATQQRKGIAMKDETLSIHHGYQTDPTTKSVATPIYQTVAYEFDNAQHGADLFNLDVPGNIYSRIMNPTNDVLEQRVAALEGGIAGLCVSAGAAAITYTMQTLAKAGDNIVATPQLYGGTYTLFAHMLPEQGIEVRFAPSDDASAIEALIDDNTKAVYCESIGNPAGNIADIPGFAKVAHAHGVPLVVDNTVATPVLCKPIEHGADIVVHSLTKYIGGHGTTLGGIIVDGGTFDLGGTSSPLPAILTTGAGLSRRGL